VSWITDFVGELDSIVAAQWTETANDRMGEKAAASINWREAVSDGEAGGSDGLTPPIAVIEIGPYRPTFEYGDANDGYLIPIKLYYLASWKIDANTRRTAAQMDILLAEKFELIRVAVKSATTFQVVNQPACDTSVKNETNQYLMKRNQQLMGAEISFDALVVISDS